ncbi:TonB family protein [Sphingomonas sp. KR3-1]|uniref:TonB family protein n=1 Tax=Sphingomonas sp. KR3-1 TaxID=3156611 RepID=UPI0032B5B7BF
MIRLLVMLLALALAPPALAQMTGAGAPDVPLAPALASRAKPLVDPAFWLGEDDYPRAALRAEQEGRVGLLLSIDLDGRVSDCTVLASSGVQLLDRHSCGLLTRRLRFTPALGRDRAPAPDRWNYVVDWKMPKILWPVRDRDPWEGKDPALCNCFTETLSGPQPRGAPDSWITAADYPPGMLGGAGDMEVTLTVDRRGATRLCRVTKSSGSRKWDRMACAILRRRARFQPEREADRKWVSRHWVQRYAWGQATARQ